MELATQPQPATTVPGNFIVELTRQRELGLITHEEMVLQLQVCTGIAPQQPAAGIQLVEAEAAEAAEQLRLAALREAGAANLAAATRLAEAEAAEAAAQAKIDEARRGEAQLAERIVAVRLSALRMWSTNG